VSWTVQAATINSKQQQTASKTWPQEHTDQSKIKPTLIQSWTIIFSELLKWKSTQEPYIYIEFKSFTFNSSKGHSIHFPKSYMNLINHVTY